MISHETHERGERNAQICGKDGAGVPAGIGLVMEDLGICAVVGNMGRVQMLFRWISALAVASAAFCSGLRAEFAVVASTSFVQGFTPGLLADIGAITPVRRADGAVIFRAKLVAEGDQPALLAAKGGVLTVLVRAHEVGGDFLALRAEGMAVWFAAHGGSTGVDIHKIDADGRRERVLADAFATVAWPPVPGWVGSGDTFALVGLFGRAGVTQSARLYRYHNGSYSSAPSGGFRAITPVQVATEPEGPAVYFLGTVSLTTSPFSPSAGTGLYRWQGNAVTTLIPPLESTIAPGIGVGSAVRADDGAFALFDAGSRRRVLIWREGVVTELVLHGARATDGGSIDLAASPRMVGIDAAHVYFALSQAESGYLRTMTVYRVSRSGGMPEPMIVYDTHAVFAKPDEVSTTVTVSDLAARETIVVGRARNGIEQAIFAGAPPRAPVGMTRFPATPADYPELAPAGRDLSGLSFRPGRPTPIAISASGAGPFAYRWELNGVPLEPGDPRFRGVNEATLTPMPFLQDYHAGTYRVAVSNAAGTSYATVRLQVDRLSIEDGGAPAPLVNYSVRGNTSVGERAFTAGITLVPPLEASGSVSGVSFQSWKPNTSQRLLVRAAGPGLAPFAGTQFTPAPSTALHLFAGERVIAANEGAWDSDVQVAPLAASVGAFPFARGSRDSALVAQLVPGSYLAQVFSNGEGTVLTEFYVVGGEGSVRNLSARSVVGEREAQALTIGFVIGDPGTWSPARTMLLRAAGPGLSRFGVVGAAERPRLELFSGQTLLASNEWHGTALNSAAIIEAGRTYGAFPLDNASADAALLLALPPGGYVMRVTAAPGSKGGVALAEIYTQVGF